MLAGLEAHLERLNLPPVHVVNGMPCVAAAEATLRYSRSADEGIVDVVLGLQASAALKHPNASTMFCYFSQPSAAPLATVPCENWRNVSQEAGTAATIRMIHL